MYTILDIERINISVVFPVHERRFCVNALPDQRVVTVNITAIDVCLYIQHIMCQSFDLNMHFVAMSDCCLTPNEQYFSYIMAITSLY